MKVRDKKPGPRPKTPREGAARRLERAVLENAGGRGPPTRRAEEALDENRQAFRRPVDGAPLGLRDSNSLFVSADRRGARAAVANLFTVSDRGVTPGLAQANNVTPGGQRATDPSSIGLNAYIEGGSAGFSTAQSWATASGGVRSAGFLYEVSDDSVMLGGSLVDADQFGKRVGVYGGVGFSADRSVTDLGDYAGQEPALAGFRKVEIRKSRTGFGELGAGILPTFLGVGVRLSVDKGKDVIFRTHLTHDAARKLIYESGGPLGAFGLVKNKARAVGLMKEVATIPSPSDPRSLKVGDEMVVTAHGSVTGGFAFGGIGPKLGAQGIVRGDFEVAVRKTAPQTVELVVTPVKVRGMEVFASSSGVFSAKVGGLSADTLRQAFRFDLSKPSGLEAYQKALGGELPNGLNDPVHFSNQAETVLELVKNERLPRGTERLFLQKVDLEVQSAGAALEQGIVKKVLKIPGLGRDVTRTVEHSVITDGEVALGTSTRGVDHRFRLLISGTEKVGVFSAVKRVTTVDDHGQADSRFAGLGLTVRLSDDRVRGFELNSDMVDRINACFGTQIGHFARSGKHQRRDVILERTLGEEDFQKIASAGPKIREEVAREARVSDKGLERLCADLRADPSPDARAVRIQKFIAREGFDGLGAVHRLAGGGADALQIQTTSSLYTAPLRTVEQLAFKFEKPFETAMGSGSLLGRFKDIRGAERRVNEALLELEDDVLLGDSDKVELRSALEEARMRLGGLLAIETIPPEVRREFREQLSWGWMSQDKAALIALLKNEPRRAA